MKLANGLRRQLRSWCKSPEQHNPYTTIIPNNTATQHDGTEYLAINEPISRCYRLLLRLRTPWWLHRWWAFRRVCPDGYTLRTGEHVHLAEAATMQFVAAYTSIPVPHVNCSFIHKNKAYIVEEVMPAAATLWSKLETLSEKERDHICSQLRVMMQELRAIPPRPGTGVQNCVGGSLHDARIPHVRGRFGPFKTQQEFHLFLREGNWPMGWTDDIPNSQPDIDVYDMIKRQDGPWQPPVFTHGNLHPGNILVEGDKIVGIVNWNYAGWYPKYWEFTSAWSGNALKMIDPAWQVMIHQFLDDHPQELLMEITRKRWWESACGCPGC